MASTETEKQIPDKLYFRIGDVSEIVGVKPYVLRYWETEFTFISPEKSSTGQRVYRKPDVEMLLLIKHLLYKERYSIEGARKRIKELRKLGELRGGNLASVQAAPIAGAALSEERKERIKRIRSLCKELRSIAKTPIDEIFGV